MITWSIRMRDTITRDIRWIDIEAETEDDAKDAAMAEMPTYRVEIVIPMDPQPEG